MFLQEPITHVYNLVQHETGFQVLGPPYLVKGAEIPPAPRMTESVAVVGDGQSEGHGRQGGRRRRDPDAVASSVAVPP